MPAPLTDIVNRILRTFRQNTDRSFTARQMYKHLGIRDDRQKEAVRQIIRQLAEQGLVKEVKEGKYKALPKGKGDADDSQSKGGVSLLDAEPIIGIMLETNHGGVVYGINSRTIRSNVVVHSADMNGAREGDKVVIEMKPHRRHAAPTGRVIEVLGKAGDNDAEMHAILAEFGLPYRYPEELEAEANTIADHIDSAEIAARHDMRSVLTFTIDPHDAKDFDDAISFSETVDDNGKHTYEVGVHIADVSYYVRPGSSIDKEAYHRGTSIYLVDRTIPMLPEHLSNDICSLREAEDKLCMAVLFHLDEQAHVLDYKIERTVICSNRRFTYEQVQEIVEKQANEPHQDLTYALITLNALAQQLRRRRFDNGAIQFDREEICFNTDENGKPISVYVKRQAEANNLIEEFMLLANRTVAETMTAKLKLTQKPFVYRVHDVPDPDKLDSLSKFIRKFGYNLKTQSERKATITKNINTLLYQVRGRAEQNLIEILTIRSMAKAVYSTDNIGHYGLGFSQYTHFTSPIRRYPDLIVHRLIADRLMSDTNGSPVVYVKDLEDACQHCSACEQLAAQAERSSVKYKQAEFMEDKVGLVFDGHISSVTEFGLFVELNDNYCEGLVPIRFVFDDDYAIYDEDNYCIRGERTDIVYTLGDEVTVRIVDVDLQRKQINMQILP